MASVDGQPGYVLHARAYRETSLLLEVLTAEHGRIGLLARGVRGPRSFALRAAVQPLQPLVLGWRGRGELPLLTQAERVGSAIVLSGNSLLAGFYLNELLVRLMPRDDPQPWLFSRYSQALLALHQGGSAGWELRRFERDLLATLGYALQLEFEADGITPIDPDATYRFDADSGATRRHAGIAELASPAGTVSGTALIALNDDLQPSATGLRELRILMRSVLLRHLDGRELRMWKLLQEVGQLRERALR